MSNKTINKMLFSDSDVDSELDSDIDKDNSCSEKSINLKKTDKQKTDKNTKRKGESIEHKKNKSNAQSDNEFKPYHVSWGIKYIGMHYDEVLKDVKYIDYLRSLNTTSKSIIFFLKYVDNNK